MKRRSTSLEEVMIAQAPEFPGALAVGDLVWYWQTGDGSGETLGLVVKVGRVWIHVVRGWRVTTRVSRITRRHVSKVADVPRPRRIRYASKLLRFARSYKITRSARLGLRRTIAVLREVAR